jgi:hypothetical protein
LLNQKVILDWLLVAPLPDVAHTQPWLEWDIRRELTSKLYPERRGLLASTPTTESLNA